MLHPNMLQNILIVLECLILLSILIFTVKLILSKSATTTILKLIIDVHSSESGTSWTRVIGTLIIIMTFGLAFYQMYKTQLIQETLIIGLVAIVLGGKVGQKAIEAKKSNNDVKPTDV
jgi:uncharacterized BrkB/YihY/UPF0761 family membrane protein